MEAEKVDMFILNNSKFFESYQLLQIRECLLKTDESKWLIVQTLQFRDPVMMLIVSLIVGTLGVDRFMIGDNGLGLGKLLTCGGLGIWAIVDYFLIMKATRERNYDKLMQLLY